ncbi:MAG: hypothetical protein ACI35R_13160 [Bacillus sp. (in: firmicutes)]
MSVHPYRQARPVVITRRRKYEIEQAVSELVAKGYELVHGPVELFSEGKKFRSDDYGRRVFMENETSSCWKAQMKREIKA